MIRIRSASILVVAAVLAGCASTGGLAPQSALRDANVLAAERTLAGTTVSSAAWPQRDWWTSLHDPQLDALITQALQDSPTLNIAAARTRKALALANAVHANELPRIDALASTARQRFSENGILPAPIAGSTQTTNTLQATLSWEIDFWGRNRAAAAAALGAARAAEVDQHAAELALSTNIAQAYVQLQRAYLDQDVAQRTLAAREQLQRLTRDRTAAGLDSRVELKQSEAAISATREQIAEIEERIALTRNQIAALLGAGPDRGLALARPTASTLARIEVPSTVPAELIGRRPDVVAQRWRIEAARRDIDVAKAEFYPNVNLAAFIGFTTFGGGSLLSAASHTVGVSPAVTLPIFDGGRLRANLAGTNADYDIAVEQYNQVIADAMRDVVDQLASLRSLATQRREQTSALASTREAYDLAVLRYREGLGNYLQVLSAEQPLLVQETLEADLNARELQLSIGLVRALGGGYAPPATIASTNQ